MARRKFQKRTAEPRPDLGPSVFEGLGCLTLLALPTVVAVLAWRGGIYAVTVVLSLLVAAFVGHFVYGRGLCLAAMLLWRPRGIRGLLVLSDSPQWQPYIEQQWLPSLGGKLKTLNWSERHRWTASLEVRLFRRFCMFRRNHCPAVIVLRGMLHPLVFRFYGAFLDSKHGEPTQLELLERRLFSALDAEREGSRAP